MEDSKVTKLNVAFVYDPKTYYLERGYSETECADLADDVTINSIDSAICKLGHGVVHVPGIKNLVGHLAAGEEMKWDLVFNFSEGVRGSARESQVPALLEAYGVVFTFSDAATLSICIDKAKTKVRDRSASKPHAFSLSHFQLNVCRCCFSITVYQRAPLPWFQNMDTR
jgi:hypothetical protein